MKKLYATVVAALFVAFAAFATTNDTNVTGHAISDVLASVVFGTATASKAVILDSNKAVDVVRTASLRIGTSGSETAVTSTAAELNILSGVTSTAADINAIAGLRVTAQAVTVAGTVDITSGLTTLNGASGTYAVTLAAPAAGSQGQIKIIRYLAGSTNAITMALTNVQGGTATTSASFAAVDQALVLMSTGTKWMVLGQAGVTLS